MSAVEIYMEGGGNSNGSKAALRKGMDRCLRELKSAARAKEWKWSLSCCGSRNEAFKTFSHACLHAKVGTIIFLLVDAELPVKARTSVQHLNQSDGWDLTGVPAKHVHLMAQTMETWIVADREALKSYFGKGFKLSALPSTLDLETVSKENVLDALTKASHKTKKGSYSDGKVLHAAKLLEQLDPGKVRKRCHHCEKLFKSLGDAIEAG